jgi:hypothetical protein
MALAAEGSFTGRVCSAHAGARPRIEGFEYHRATMKRLIVLTLFCAAIPACGPGVDREATLTRLRAALEADVTDEDVLREHNELVTTVREGSVLHGMRRSEVQERLGRGQECGVRELCAEHGFTPTDWTYEVGQRDGMAWGPTLIVGFDRQGIVDGVYTLTRNN